MGSEWHIRWIDWSDCHWPNRLCTCVLPHNSRARALLLTARASFRIPVKPFFASRRLDFLSNLIFRSRFYFLTTIDVDIFGDYLLQPFSKSVWISIGVATLCISIALQFISQHDQSLKISSFIATFGIYCQQGIFLFPMILKVKHRSSFFFRRLSYTKTYVRPLFIHTVAFIQHYNLQLLYIRFGVDISEVSIEKQNK